MSHPQRLTLGLIQSCLALSTPETDDDKENDDYTGLLNTTSLRLGWQKIEVIENLDMFTSLRELYLQHNNITHITGLDTLLNLKLLSLGHNRIAKVSGLKPLKKLVLLDLSHNQLSNESDVEELRCLQGLRSLEIRHNSVCEADNFHSRLLHDLLPNLLELNCRQTAPVAVDITVHEEDGTSKVVPLEVSAFDCMCDLARELCDEHGLIGQEDALQAELEGALRKENRRNRVLGVGEAKKELGEGQDREVTALQDIERAQEAFRTETERMFGEVKEGILREARAKAQTKVAAARARGEEHSEEVAKIIQQARDQFKHHRE
ncbi:unnamed protein product, partial [Chrysoparadoxa australica]